MNIDFVKKVLSDEAFVKTLSEMDTNEQMQSALAEKGIDLTDKDMEIMRTLFEKVKQGELDAEKLAGLQKKAEDGELSDAELELVAGGVDWFSLIIVIVIVGFVSGAVKHAWDNP